MPALFVPKGTPHNGWGAAPRGTYEFRRSLRRINGKLLHDGPHVADTAADASEDGNTVTLKLKARVTYTVGARRLHHQHRPP